MTRAPDNGSSGHWRTVNDLELPRTLVGALTSFHARGFHGTSIREIARLADVQLPTLYYHHDNKEGMLVALLRVGMDELLERVGRAVAAAGDHPVARLSNLVEATVLHMTARVELAGLDNELRHIEKDNPHRLQYTAQRKELQALLTSIIVDGVAIGLFDVGDDVEDTVRSILGSTQAITTWFRRDGPNTPAELADRYSRIALRTVGARPHAS